ncbi:5-formyltetrahydrofolate cyclo-ligase [Sphingomonas paeninsulae]|jgi:5-formyltetrahydrofolate cyclo-ligase|uniref:5-formyltetrahydrofolate cyclo-ligase n=1 Tax=Sphingomonas paeninsulae TaxID=2319844 RepID=A0A494TKU3_SPHPE|nr:5-formyltetrahydrofolate cyclo-ligase [Sphingomonas paeninsulae]AYJ85735.1 5-formyltetrahydrofolate cyclo-ligase [Sphingomonas paeninsulae]
MAVPPLISADALSALRRDMRKLRRHIAKAENWRPASLNDELNELISKSSVIGLYAPMSGEPDPTLVPRGQSPKIFSRPALTDENLLEFRQWTHGDREIPSSWGGFQPATSAPVVHPDVIFVPLVAFDGVLNRLGQGGGHYDRYLADNGTALRIGVAWEAQRVDLLPVRPWDVPLDAVITEQNCYTKELQRCLSR